MSEIDQELDPQGSVALRVAVLFGEMRMRIFKQTDRLFAGLMVLQWLGAIIAALCLSPRIWAGPESYVNIHVWAAIFLGGALTILPVALVLLRPGAALTRHVIAVCEMLFSALLIDITGGSIETHFHIFGALALLAFYRDWRVLITASAVVAIHHGVFGVLAPQDIYGVSVVQPWRWVQHTGWVVFEDVFLIISITQSLKEMMGLAERQVGLETVNARIEQEVDLRTGELERSRSEALHNLEEPQQARGKAEAAEQELLKAKNAAEAAEARLRRREAMFRQLFDAVPDLVTVSRLSDGKFIEVNAEFLRRTGLSREKALTTSTLETGQWARPEERDLFVQKLKADGHVREFEVDFRLQGVVVPYLASSVVIEVDGETCTLGVGHDITRIREGERALKEAQQRLSAQVEELTSTQRELIVAREAAMDASRAKSEFLSSMSHEIRTPMNAILGMAELLEETPLNRDQEKYLSIISHNGDALLVLINDVLDLAKVEAGRLVLEQIDFDLENLSDKVVETLSLGAHSKGLELAVHLMPGVPRQLAGDPLRLRQILINLIGNSIKFTETGQVLLTVERDGASGDPGALRFAISDTGIGIAKDTLGALFSNFTQADSSTTRRYGGSGLGLAIVKRLVGLMNGRIWVESELGVGSTFYFTARFEVRDAPRAVESSAVAVMLTRTRALVVDDNATNRLILREMLTSRGAEVSEAEDGPQGLALLERARLSGQPFNLLLLDCRMPGMDGFQVAERIKAIGYDGMPLLMLTSDNLKIELARVGKLGLDAYLVKPVRRLELFEAIAAAMARHNGYLRPAGEEPFASSGGAIGAQERPLRILLAEDVAVNRFLVHAYLKASGTRIDEAENGLVAVEKAKTEKYDLILMDTQMPVMGGLEAMRLIRQRERQDGLERTPIIALTASALENDVRHSLDAGADLHVSKPIKKATLLAAIESVVPAAAAAPPTTPEQNHEASGTDAAHHRRIVA
jgi:two-component system sensor histidine kinase/response regulator